MGFERRHHGLIGVGTPAVPAVQSDVAVFALGDVWADGELVATGVPVHVMTMDDDMPALALRGVAAQERQ